MSFVHAFKTCVRRQVEETPKLLTAFFRGLICTTPDNVKRRQAVFCAAVRLLQNGDLSTNISLKLVSTLLIEIRLFPADCLASLSELFIESFKSGEYSPGKWMELFPQILSCVTTHEKVPYVDGHVTGAEYKSHAVNTICASKWPSNMIVGLTTLFNELNLSYDELKYVLDKVLRTLKDAEYDSIPPLVYQTLLLCVKGYKKLVLEGLITFFNEEETKCRETEKRTEQDSDLDVVEESSKQDDLRRCEGTVLLHVLYAIRNDKDLGDELIKILQAYRCLPKRIISPFILCLSLCVASEEQFQQNIFNCLKASIMHSHKETMLQKRSCWVREILHDEYDINDAILQTISISANGWDHVTQGLVEFGFMLLDVHGPKIAVGKSNKSSNWQSIMACGVGSDITWNTFKENRTVRQTILSELLSRIVPTNTSLLKQHLALLTKTIQYSQQTYSDCITKFQRALDYLIHLPASLALKFLNSIQPLLSSNSSLRDAVIVLLHKAMFSRQLECRKIAVSGFLNCLKHFRVMGALPNSQGSQTSRLSSQYSADVHVRMKSATNEALCLEVLGMLRRAFTQQAGVRMLLYNGFPGIISTSPYLIDNVLDMLQAQACLYVEPRDLPPLHLQKCYKIQGNEVIYLEPVPHLLRCINKCTKFAKSRHSTSNESESADLFDAETWNHPLLTFMDELTAAMIKADLEHFELDKAADYSFTTSVGAKNYLTASIVLGVYEALMEYSFLKDNKYSTSMAENVLRLFENYNKLIAIIKEKPGKAKAKTKGTKKPKARNETQVSVRKHTTVLSSHFITIIAKALVLDNLPDHQEALSDLRQHEQFQLFLHSIAVQKIMQIQDSGSFENEEQTNEELFQYCCALGKIFLYRFCTEPTCSKPTGILIMQTCLEGFSAAVTVVDERFAEKLPVFLTSLLGDKARAAQSQPHEAGEIALTEVLKRVQRLITKALSSDSDSAKFKVVGPLIKIISLLIDHLPHSSPPFKDICDWVDQLCAEKSIDDVAVVKALLSLLLKVNAQTPTHLNCMVQLAEDAYNTLGDIDESAIANATVHYLLVNVETAGVIVVLILEHLENFMSIIEWIISSMKAKFSANDKDTINPDAQRIIEKRICSALGMIASSLHSFATTLFPMGPIIENIILRLTKLYLLLAEFTKYFLLITRPAGQMCSRFEKLVMFINDQLTRQLYGFLTFVQQQDSQEGGRRGANKKGPGSHFSKALKQSRLMPRLVYQIEQYESSLIRLSNRTKNAKLTSKMRISINRDFRINFGLVQEVLDKQQEPAGSCDEQDVTAEEPENTAAGNQLNEISQNSAPPSKRQKLGIGRKTKKLAPKTSQV